MEMRKTQREHAFAFIKTYTKEEFIEAMLNSDAKEAFTVEGLNVMHGWLEKNFDVTVEFSPFAISTDITEYADITNALSEGLEIDSTLYSNHEDYMEEALRVLNEYSLALRVGKKGALVWN